MIVKNPIITNFEFIIFLINMLTNKKEHIILQVNYYLEVVYMSNENDNKGSVLAALFESREENLYSLNEKNKEKIKNLTKNNDGYEKLFGILEDLSNTPQNLEKSEIS